jgi:hypothetical protein
VKIERDDEGEEGGPGRERRDVSKDAKDAVAYRRRRRGVVKILGVSHLIKKTHFVRAAL